jgi:hypothetical protein
MYNLPSMRIHSGMRQFDLITKCVVCSTLITNRSYRISNA